MEASDLIPTPKQKNILRWIAERAGPDKKRALDLCEMDI